MSKVKETFDTLTREYNGPTIWENLPEESEKEQLLYALYKKSKKVWWRYQSQEGL